MLFIFYYYLLAALSQKRQGYLIGPLGVYSLLETVSFP